MIEDTLTFIKFYYSKSLIIIYTLVTLNNSVIFILENNEKHK